MLEMMRRQKRAQLDMILQRGQQQSVTTPLPMLGGGEGSKSGTGGGGASIGGLVAADAAVGTALGAAGVTGGGSALASLLSLLSSRRFKHEVETLGYEGGLRWVTYRYLPDMDPAQELRVGLIAEEVEQVRPGLVFHDAGGRALGIHYGLV